MRQRLFPSDHPDVATGLNNVAFLLKARGDLAGAEPLYRQCFEMTERLRTGIVGDESSRAEFAAAIRLPARAAAYAGCLIELGRGDEAFGILERGRARAALDLMARAGRDLAAELRASADPAMAERAAKLDAAEQNERQAKIAVADAEAMLAGRRKEREALEKRDDLAGGDGVAGGDGGEKATRLASFDQEIAGLFDEVKDRRRDVSEAGSAVLVELRGLFPAGQALATGEVLAALSPGEMILGYAWTAERIVAVTAASGSGDRAGSPPLPPGEGRSEGSSFGRVIASTKEEVNRLAQLAARARASIESRSAAPDQDAMTELRAALLPQEVADQIAAALRLVVLPDGPLSGIPFEALLEHAPPIAYAPSATMYVDRRKLSADSHQPSAARAALIVGDPVFDRDSHDDDAVEYPQSGVLIAAVTEESNAASGGLVRGDVILRYADADIADRASLNARIAEVNQEVESGSRPGDERFAITIWRDGEEVEANLAPGRMGVQLANGPPEAALRSMANLERGFEQLAIEASALDQVWLFGGRLPPLPGTRREAEAIAAIISRRTGKKQPAATTLLLGEDATIGRVRAAVAGASNGAPPRYLHFATHGLMGSPRNPDEACLALTRPEVPGADDIGFLKLEELTTVWLGDLRGCDLVVLSACETGRGQTSGDTNFGLPLGFFAAGAPTVIASLWKVDDTATALLMARLYASLLGAFDQPRTLRGREIPAGAPMAKLEALDEAKQWLRGLSEAETEALMDAGTSPDTQPLLLAASRGVTRETDDAARAAVNGEKAVAAVDRPYRHPHFWAGFILLGDPE
jgi:CHAT domain-containing protein